MYCQLPGFKCFVITILILAFLPVGCTLDPFGTRPVTVCHVEDQNLKASITPFNHKYTFAGNCQIGDKSATFDVSALWEKKGNNATGKAVVGVNYNGQDLEAYITADCPDGDPILYDVSCTSRAISGSLIYTEVFSLYYHVFKNHMMPDILGEDQKAALREKDHWERLPCKVFLPQPGMPPNLNYRNPSSVFIAFQLPITEEEPEHWSASFKIARFNPDTQVWMFPQQYTTENTFLSGANTYTAIKRLSLDKGRYKLSDAGCQYYDDHGNMWNCDESDFSVIFWVGKPGLHYPIPQ